MNILIGGQGYLGKHLKKHVKNIISLDRTVYEHWFQDDQKNMIKAYFEEHFETIEAIWVTAGLLNPACAPEQHERINYHLPKNIIASGCPTVTFGTIMEEFSGRPNAYAASKRLLSDFVREHAPNGLHIRLHTLYGGNQLPHSFMFLGQLFHALKTKTRFDMSLGTQLREYHHVEDDVTAAMALFSSHARGIVNLNHGEALSLKSIAEHVFKVFHAEKLLNIGALPQPDQENYDRSFKKNSMLEGISFRETLTGITEYLENCLTHDEVAA